MLTAEQLFNSDVWVDLTNHFNRFEQVIRLTGAGGFLDNMPTVATEKIKASWSKYYSIGEQDLGSFAMGFLYGLMTTLPSVQDSLERWMESGFNGPLPTSTVYFVSLRKVFMEWYTEELAKQEESAA